MHSNVCHDYVIREYDLAEGSLKMYAQRELLELFRANRVLIPTSLSIVAHTEAAVINRAMGGVDYRHIKD